MSAREEGVNKKVQVSCRDAPIPILALGIRRILRSYARTRIKKKIIDARH